jgi:hypothetical protein
MIDHAKGAHAGMVYAHKSDLMKLTLTATIEARKLNKRTLAALNTFPVTIPYGSTLENIKDLGKVTQFSYLGEPYDCETDRLAAASRPL